MRPPRRPNPANLNFPNASVASEARGPVFHAAQFTLRLPKVSDAQQLKAFIQRCGSRYEPPLPSIEPRSEKQALSFWNQECRLIQLDFLRGAALRCFLYVPDETRVIGSIALSRIQRGVRCDAALSFALDADYEGQGLMTRAARFVLGFAFGELGLHRLEATFRPENLRSRKLLLGLGFEIVGLIPSYVRFGEKWCDATLVSLTSERWASSVKAETNTDVNG